MAGVDKTIVEALDGVALKIVMIEPGDLSMVGEVLEPLEKMLASPGLATLPDLQAMTKAVKTVMEKIVMMELSDNDENYERLSGCVTIMQETVRNEGVPDKSAVQAFIGKMAGIGYAIEGDFAAEASTAPSGATPTKSAAIPIVDDKRFEFLNDPEMLASFIEESVENLQSIEMCLMELEQKPDDTDSIHKIFRSFHTMKGIANCLNLTTIGGLAHATESLLDDVRNQRRPMDALVIDVVLSVGDNLRTMVDNVRECQEKGPECFIEFDTAPLLGQIKNAREMKAEPAAEPPPPPEPERAPETPPAAPAAPVTPAAAPPPPGESVAAESAPGTDIVDDKELLGGFVDEASEHLESIEVNILDLEQNPNDLEIVNKIFRPFHTIKGVSGFLNLKTINKLAHVTENLLDDVRNGIRPMDSEIIEVVLSVGDSLRAMVDNVREVLDKGQQAFKHFDISHHVNRIADIQGNDAVTTLAAAPAISAASEPPPAGKPLHLASAVHHAPSLVATPKTPRGDLPEVEEQIEEGEGPGRAPRGATQPAAAKGKFESTIKVNVDKLDALVNAVGELVIMQSLVQENPHISAITDPKLTKDFSQLMRITSELQKTAMSMRMVPIRQTFQKMIRLVRDLSKKSGKRVDLIMEGEETEIDRNMVDSIYDPLVHMIRNSVDHGVQMPQERVRMGKPELGTIWLRAFQKGGNMVIEIEDDGNGLSTDRIRKKAIDRGLIKPEDNLSDHDLNNLIFMPGFSTAEKITDVSGRGVGMDVVKKAVEKLRGKVDVYTEQGKGTRFVIKLPLTLAIIDGIIVRLGAERYIIPTIAIRESFKPERENYKTVHGKGEVVLVRNMLIPIIRLYEIFGVTPNQTDPCESILVVVESEGKQRALMVDELLGKQEVVIKSLGGLMMDVKGVAGGTILGDGRVGLILDVAGLVQ